MTRFRFFALILLTALPLTAHAGPACSDVFLESPSGRGGVRAIGDSKEPAYAPTGDVAALKQARVQNQCKTSECYLFSFVGLVETHNLNQGKADAPTLSAEYLFAKKMMQWARETAWFERPETQRTHLLEGGFFHRALLLSREHGAVPVESWQPKIPFKDWDFARLYADVESAARRARKQVHGGALTSWFKDQSPEARKQRFLDALPELQQAVERWTGPLPTEVDLRGQRFQVKDLERRYGLDHRTRIEMLYPENRWVYDRTHLENGFRTSITAFGGTWSYGPAAPTALQGRIRQWIDAGSPVMVEMAWGSGGHAMVVVGYETNAAGHVTRWKLQNSWGDQWSDRGSAWYEPADLQRNLWGAYFLSAPGSARSP